MRKVAVLLGALVLVVAACGGGGGAKQSHSVVDVSKAFYDAGIPFTAVVTGNRYVSGQVPFLPGSLNASDLRFDVQAQLSASDVSARTGLVAWVFDTNAHAEQALKTEPLAGWTKGALSPISAVDGNVVIIASGFTGSAKAKLDEALSALK